MRFQFNNYIDMTDFAKRLGRFLLEKGFRDESMRINMFSVFFDLPSVYLGEFRIALSDILKENIISDREMRENVETTINQINESFDKANGIK